MRYKGEREVNKGYRAPSLSEIRSCDGREDVSHDCGFGVHEV